MNGPRGNIVADINGSNDIAPPRIGGGRAYFVLGAIFIALGLFGLVAASGGGQGAAAFGVAALALGGGLLTLGFWVRLFGLLEARLIDLQRVAVWTRGQPEVAYVNAQAAVSATGGTTSEASEMSELGIQPEGTHFLFNGKRYANLDYALKDARIYAAGQNKPLTPNS